ncbi:hypothetical protein LCGC14_2593360 [marine sediment metagenome]|uniref:Polynucleotide kinase n=1 Tax=marine sediment metagenome TaxID=412755 RepID=A0A0F9AB02_9ZZZZ
MKPTIAVDFDGVIHKYSKGWDDGSIYDEPMDGCRDALQKLSETYHILIFSARNYDRVVGGETQSNQVREMEFWLNKYRIPYDEIYTKPAKPLCKLFIDDNAYRFEGNWSQCVDDVESLLGRRTNDN